VKPLDGIVVLDLTRLLPGAAATQTLAAFGAEVIKVEEPGTGDYGRMMPPLVDGMGAVFRQVNRGKKSIAVNLKTPRGRDLLLGLAQKADVLIEGFRPGVMKRLGLDAEALQARNPRLIYATISGYGQSGPWAGMAGHDINYMALAGVLDLIGLPDGAPVIPGVQLADLAGGTLQALIGILLALAARAKTGRGQRVDVGMMQGLEALLPVARAWLGATGAAPERGRQTLSGRYACYNVYQARDGRWLAVGALEPKFWADLCRRLGCEQFVPDQFAEGARQQEIIAALREIFRQQDSRRWFESLKEYDCCVTPVLRLDEAETPAGVAPWLGSTPGRIEGAAPLLGEHTQPVLREAGVSQQEIDALAREGVIQG